MVYVITHTMSIHTVNYEKGKKKREISSIQNGYLNTKYLIGHFNCTNIKFVLDMIGYMT